MWMAFHLRRHSVLQSAGGEEGRRAARVHGARMGADPGRRSSAFPGPTGLRRRSRQTEYGIDRARDTRLDRPAASPGRERDSFPGWTPRLEGASRTPFGSTTRSSRLAAPGRELRARDRVSAGAPAPDRADVRSGVGRLGHCPRRGSAPARTPLGRGIAPEREPARPGQFRHPDPLTFGKDDVFPTASGRRAGRRMANRPAPRHFKHVARAGGPPGEGRIQARRHSSEVTSPVSTAHRAKTLSVPPISSGKRDTGRGGSSRATTSSLHRGSMSRRTRAAPAREPATRATSSRIAETRARPRRAR